MTVSRFLIIAIAALALTPQGATAQVGSFPDFSSIRAESEELLNLQARVGLFRNAVNCALEHASGESDLRRPCQYAEEIIEACDRGQLRFGNLCDAAPNVYEAARYAGVAPRRGVIQWEGREVIVNQEAALPLHATLIAMTALGPIRLPHLMHSDGRRIGGVGFLEWGASVEQAVLVWGMPEPNASDVLDAKGQVSYRTSRVLTPDGLEEPPVGLVTFHFDGSRGLVRGRYVFPFATIQACEAIYRDLRNEFIDLFEHVPVTETPVDDLNPNFCSVSSEDRGAQYSQWRDGLGGMARLRIGGSGVVLDVNRSGELER